ncbi:rCG50158 [Rattus norvegicus]|uniref:RCG50158 n=1 Tax=Rattus norvegicus TaxID=10116 RepID=A6JYQ5_RAT|nr:rCG50158 [Rattus norvegicus]
MKKDQLPVPSPLNPKDHFILTAFLKTFLGHPHPRTNWLRFQDPETFFFVVPHEAGAAHVSPLYLL